MLQNSLSKTFGLRKTADANKRRCSTWEISEFYKNYCVALLFMGAMKFLPRNYSEEVEAERVVITFTRKLIFDIDFSYALCYYSKT